MANGIMANGIMANGIMANVFKLIQIYQSQMTILHQMYEPSSFAYCYYLINEICSGLALSDSIMRHLL
jgi:hypothetical protein